MSKAEEILRRWNAGWRFATDWPPGFKSRLGPVEKRGGHMSEKSGLAWRGFPARKP